MHHCPSLQPKDFRMSRLFRRTVFALAAAATLLVPGASQAALDPNTPIPTGPEVKVGKLGNGLTYYIRQNKQPQRRLELRLVVKAGSILEDEDQRGLAHFVEHMAFNGSTHFKRHEVVSYLQSIGMRYGADLNAFTSFDQTWYILPVPTARQEDIDKGFTILEDWAHGISFDDADIERERSVILEEARVHKGAGERVQKALLPKQYNGSRYADRLAIGTDESIRSFKPDALRRFYRDWYRPELMAVVAVGDVEPEELERQIKLHFGHLQNPASPRPRTYEAIRPRERDDALVVTDPELQVNSVALHYPVRPAAPFNTIGAFRERLLNSLVQGMLAQRLAELSQQASPPFLNASSGLAAVTPRYRAYVAAATLGAGGTAPALAALIGEQQRARRDGFSSAELELVRKNLMRAHERYYDGRNGLASAAYVNEYMRSFLDGEALPGAEGEYRIVQELLPAITLDEVNAHARAMIPADAAKLAVYIGGDAAAAPSSNRLLADVVAAGKSQLAAHEDRAVAAQLMARPANPGKVVDESTDKALGITRLSFSNGVKVVIKPTGPLQDQVLLSAHRFGGVNLFDEKDLPSARYAGGLMPNMGLKDFTPLDLRRALAGRNASVSVQLGADTDDIGGGAGSKPEDLEAMLQMLWLRFDGVRRDEDLYKSFMAKQAEALRHRDASPQTRFADAQLEALYVKNPYQPRAPALADLARVDLDRSIALYRQRFASAKGFTFVLVGNLEVEKIKPLLAAYLGTLPTPDLPVAYRDVGVRYASGVVKRELKAGTEAQSTVSLNFTGPATWSPEESLRLETLVEVMNLRIVDVLREKMGLIYSGRMGGGISMVPWQHYRIGTALPTAPEQVVRLTAALFAEIEQLKREGPSQSELDKVKRTWSQTWTNNLRNNAFWLGALSSAELYGTDPHRILDQMQRAAALSAEDVKRAAQRYFNTENYVQVVLNPEASAAQQKPALATALTPR
jgi:zinc protease